MAVAGDHAPVLRAKLDSWAVVPAGLERLVALVRRVFEDVWTSPGSVDTGFGNSGSRRGVLRTVKGEGVWGRDHPSPFGGAARSGALRSLSAARRLHMRGPVLPGAV
jgi:hypothetical protein